MHYLMIKKHVVTGLMYLCKTASKKAQTDPLYPYQYKGSGIRWRRHLKKHGDCIITCVIGVYETVDELVRWGKYYSDVFEVVSSPNWANLTEEKGDGGLIGDGQLGKRWKCSDLARENMRAERRLRSNEFYEKQSAILAQQATGEANHQFKGWYVTPWGTFSSIKQVTRMAQHIRAVNPALSLITDGATIRKYVKCLDEALPTSGRRTPSSWRGKTPRELGFDFRQKE